MNRKQYFSIISLILLIINSVTGWAITSSYPPGVYNVTSSTSYPTLQSAITAAVDGDLISCGTATSYPGIIYSGSISLTVINSSGGIVNIQGSSPALAVSGPGSIKFDGFSFNGVTSNDPAIRVDGGTLILRNSSVTASVGFMRSAIQISNSGYLNAGLINDFGKNTFICDNDSAINNTTLSNSDAYGNWWGDASGPSIASNPGATGYPISNYINYNPFSINTGFTGSNVVDIGLFIGSQCGTFDLKLKPGTTTTGILTGIVFTIRWASGVYDQDLQNIVFPAPFTGLLSQQGPRITTGGYHYVTFAGLPNISVNWASASENLLMTFGITGSYSGTITFEVMNDSYTYDTNKDYSIDIDGQYKNGCFYHQAVNSPSPATWTSILTTQCNSSTVYALSGGTPLPGAYSGPGTSGTNFSASASGAPGSRTLTYTFTDPFSGCSSSATNSILVIPSPPAVAGANRAICLGGSSQIGAASVPGNTYSWVSNPVGFTSTLANPTVSPIITTTYTVVETITATGCTDTHSVIVTVNPLPAAVAGADRAICFGSSSQIGAASVAGSTYSWTSNPAGFTSTLANPTVSPAVLTTYTVVETITATGCTNTHSVIVSIIPLPAANAGADRSICYGTSSQIGAANVVGSTYSWTSVPAGFTSTLSNPIVSPTATTTYTVVETVTATGCANTHSVIVTIIPLPAANAGTGIVICLGSSTQIGAANVVGSSYSWTSVPAGFTSTISNPTVNPIVSTTYTVVETNTTTGCVNSNSVLVTIMTLPSAVAGTDRSICTGNNTQLGAAAVSGATYSWTSVPAGFTSTSANPTVNPTVATTYTLVETITAGGCNNTNSVTVSVNPIPAAAAGTDRSICLGANSQIGATAVVGNSYSWTSVPAGFTSTLADPMVSPSVTTNYSVIETISATGCTNTHNVVVTILPLPAAVAGTNSSICPGSSVQIGAASVAGSNYSWTSVPAGFNSTSANPTVNPAVSTTYTVVETNTATTCANSNSVVISVISLPAAVAGTDRSICTGASTQLGTTADPGATYNWVSVPAGFSSTSANPTVSPAVTTTYTVTETITAGGCNNSNSVTVTVNPIPDAVAGTDRIICSGSNTQIGASGIAGNTYSWTSIPAGFTSTSANPTVSPLVSTTYTLVETITATGCTNTHSVLVTVLSTFPAAVAGTNRSICTGNATQIGASTVAGSTYSWTSVPVGFTSTSANPLVNPTVTTTYTIVETITIGGCSSTNSVTVTVNPNPDAVAGADRTICLGANSQIGASSVLGSTYSWTSVPAGYTSTSANPTVNPLVSTTYTLIETITATGCTNTHSVIVTVNPIPAANAGANRSICAGVSTQIGAASVAGNSYSWSSVPAGFTSTTANPSVNPALTTTYTLIETITLTGCTNTHSVIVTVNPLPAATAGADRTLCLGSSTQLGAANVVGSTYSWTSVPAGFTSTIANPTVTPSVATTYTLVQTITATGCTNTHSVIVSINPLPAAVAGSNRAICTGENSQIGAVSVLGNTYNWTSVPAGYTSTSSNPTVSPTITTTYTVVETITATGCTNTHSVIVTVNPLPDAYAGPDRTICYGATTQLGASGFSGNTYSWTSVPVGFTSTTANPTVNPTASTTYTLVETKTATGCTNTNNVIVTVIPVPDAVAGANRAICIGSSSQIGAVSVAGNTYSWTSIPAGFTSTSSNPTVSPVVTTTYTLVETITATGCANTHSVVVTVNPLPAAIAGADRTICYSSNSQIGDVSIVGNIYSWTSTPAGFTSSTANPTVSPLITTTYTLIETITASGCTNTHSVIVTVNPIPSAVAGADRAICSGGSSQIGAAAVGGSTYSWASVPAGFTSTTSNPTVSPIVTTTYTVVETITATGCTNTHSLIVTVNPLPAAIAGSNRTICSGASSQIGASSVVGNTYSWTSVPVGFTSATSNPTVSPAVSTTYTVLETITATGCSSSHSVIVTANPLPAATAGSNRVICSGSSSQIGAAVVAGSTYTWSSVPVGFSSTLANPNVSPTVTTTYSVVETITATGCTNTHSVVVTVNPIPVAFDGDDRAICLGTTTQLGAVSVVGNTYSWTSLPVGFTSTLSNPTVSPVVMTTFTIVETITATGCTNSHSVTVSVNPLPVVTWSGSLTAQCISNTSYTLSGGSPALGTYSGSGVTGTNFDASASGAAGTKTLTYSYTNPVNGCVNSATKSISVSAVLCGIYIKTILQGAYSSTLHAMRTDLQSKTVIPTNQPFNVSPWNYSGLESHTSPFPSNVVDWVLVELRDVDHMTRITRKAALLLNDGSVADINGNAPLFMTGYLDAHQYYVTIYHRNHIIAMTSSAVSFPNSILSTFDFTTDPATSLWGGSNATIQLEPGVFGLIAGDINNDNILIYSGLNNDRGKIIDRIGTLVSPLFYNSLAYGYYPEDLTMNDTLKYSGNGNDQGIIFANIDNFTDPSFLNSIYTGPVPLNFAKTSTIPDKPQTGLIDIMLKETSSELKVVISTRELIKHSFIDNIQFCLSWDENSTDIKYLLENYSSEYEIKALSPPILSDGKYYQTFGMVDWVLLPDYFYPNNEITVLKFPKVQDFSQLKLISISSDRFTNDNNSSYYISLAGRDHTGKIFNGGTNSKGNNSIVIYPNPSSGGIFTLLVDQPQLNISKIVIRDITSRIVFEENDLETNANLIRLDLSNLTNGVYHCLISTNEDVTYKIIIKE